MCNEIWSYGFCNIPWSKPVEATHQGFLLMLCSVISFVFPIYKIRTQTNQFSSRNFATWLKKWQRHSLESLHIFCLLGNFIWREVLAVMICDDDEASLPEHIPLLWVYSGDLLQAPRLNALSRHRRTLFLYIGIYPSSQISQRVYFHLQHTTHLEMLPPAHSSYFFVEYIQQNDQTKWEEAQTFKQMKHKTVSLRFVQLVQPQLSSRINNIFTGNLRTLTLFNPKQII